MKVQDGYSTTATATVFDYFNVKIKYECDDDILSLSSDITMFVYSTSSGVADSIAANFAQTIVGCLIDFKAEVYDGPVGSSGFSSITLATTSSWLDITNAAPNADLAWRQSFTAGTLTIFSDSVSYNPYKDFAVRITYTSIYSQKP
jgi:hypothetical protein